VLARIFASTLPFCLTGRKDNPLAIALSLEFVEVENNFSEAVFALDVGDRVKNPQLFFDIPVAALPAETVRSAAAGSTTTYLDSTCMLVACFRMWQDTSR